MFATTLSWARRNWHWIAIVLLGVGLAACLFKSFAVGAAVLAGVGAGKLKESKILRQALKDAEEIATPDPVDVAEEIEKAEEAGDKIKTVVEVVVENDLNDGDHAITPPYEVTDEDGDVQA